MKTRRAARFGASLSVTVVCFCLFGAEGSMSYRFVLKWGSWGSSDGEFDNPTGVAVDSEGNVFVADNLNYRVQKFDFSGNFLMKWGALGSGNGEFQALAGVATWLDPSGHEYVFVADMSNHRIQKFDSSGNFLMKWGSEGSGEGQFRFPVGVAADSSGNVFVADGHNHRIQKFDSYGEFLIQWGSEGSDDGEFLFPRFIAVDSWGNVLVPDNGNRRIQKFDSAGNFLMKWGSEGSGEGQFNGPYGVAADSWGRVFVADARNHEIQTFDSSGNFLTKWGSEGSGKGQFNAPGGIAVDSSGNVFVSDTMNRRIQKFRPHRDIRIMGQADSALIEWHGAPFKRYQVWVSADLFDWKHAGGIQPYSESGVYLWTDGGLHELGPASESKRRYYRVEQLTNPAIVYNDGGNIWVMDADGGNETLVLADAGSQTTLSPRWSPDGTQIAFNGLWPSGTYAVNLDGSEPTFLAPRENWGDTTGAVWSPVPTPDGEEKLLFVSVPVADGCSDLFLMNTDGTGLVNLTNTPDVHELGPTWAPDGCRFAVEEHESYGDHILIVYELGLDGGGNVVIVDKKDISALAAEAGKPLPNERFKWLAWANTQDKIAWTLPPEHDIWILDLATYDMEQLTGAGYGAEGGERHSTWSPDDSKIAYWTSEGSGEDNEGIFVTEVDTGVAKILNRRGRHPDWWRNWTEQ